jgi:hypothetical protein
LELLNEKEIMSIKDEQLQEIEALNSIYPEEITGFISYSIIF